MSRKQVGADRFIVSIFVLIFSIIGLSYAARGQALRSVMEPRGRVFTVVGAGVTALKRDAQGRYYVLGRPANTITVFGPHGKLLGHIPNAAAAGAIRYAVDFDLTPSGLIAVADRGANAIALFRADGSLVSRIPVFAPTSIVALPHNEFAITTLRASRLVQIVDLRGNVLQSFGDPDAFGKPPADDQEANRLQTEQLEADGLLPRRVEALHDYGTITGDSHGGIYFAFASTPNPTVRKYDRFGYQAYQSSIPKSAFGIGSDEPEDRLQLVFGASDISYSSQAGAWLSLGSSKDVKFGGDVGPGLGGMMQQGFGLGQVIAQQNMNETSMMGGPQAGTFSGEVSSLGSSLQLGPGKAFGSGGKGQGAGSGQFGGQTTSGGALLNFSGSNEGAYGYGTNGTLDSGAGNTAGLGLMGASNVAAANASTWLTQPGAEAGVAPEGLSAPYAIGSAFNSLYFRPPGLSASITGTKSSGRAKGSSGSATSGSTSTKLPSYPGGLNIGSLAFTAGLRVNLGHLNRGLTAKKPRITAIAVDPQTEDVWATIGDTLVQFNKNGTLVGLYYLSLAGGEPLNATALLVEPNRLLIAADPWGIFQFPRPDKPAAQQQKSRIVAKAAAPSR